MSRITDLTAITTPALTDFIALADVSDTTYAASGTDRKMLLSYILRQNSGTAFPVANLWDGMPFMRTDLGGIACTYDETNTRWLSAASYCVSRFGYNNASNPTLNNFGSTRSDYAVVFDRIEISSYAATNDASNYWSVEIRSYDATLANYTVIYSFDTSADGTSVTNHSGAATTPTPTYYGQLRTNSAYGAGTPATLVLYPAVYYRLVIPQAA